jgi:hypothetical protein
MNPFVIVKVDITFYILHNLTSSWMVLVKAPNAQLAQDAMNNAIVRHKPNTSNLMFHSDQGTQYSSKAFIDYCFLSSAAKNLRYFTKNKPSFCQNKKIVAITSHFLKFQAQAAIKTLISSPTCPLSRFLESLKSDLKCPIIGAIAARLLYSLRFLVLLI